MQARYHRQMTSEALGELFSPAALKIIIQANLNQDKLPYLLGGYPHYHFDDSAFERTYTYLNHQRAIVLASLTQTNPTPAWEAFGHITHALQDFYAHTNYIHLWLKKHPTETPPDPAGVDPLIPDLLNHPQLISARNAIFLEILKIIPLIGRRLLPLFPPHVHARMNLDQPSSGPLFPYAFHAARKRTSLEFEALAETIRDNLDLQSLSRFLDKDIPVLTRDLIGNKVRGA